MTVLPITIGILVAGGVYLLCQPGLVRIVFGITLLSHGANLVLLASGVSAWRGEPLTLASGDRLIAAGDARIHDAAVQILAG